MDTMTTADTQPSLAEIEAALDAGKLWYQVLPGRYWRLRRNGRTKTWQRPQPGWRIPVKWGFRFAGSVDNADTVERSAPGAIVISDEDPSAVQK